MPFWAVKGCSNAAMPAAHAVFLPKVGHLSNLEAPLAFNAALTEFLGRL